MKCEEVIELVTNKNDRKALIRSLGLDLSGDSHEILLKHIGICIDQKEIKQKISDFDYISDKTGSKFNLRDVVLVTDIIMELLLNSVDYYMEEKVLKEEVRKYEESIQKEASTYELGKKCRNCNRDSDASKFAELIEIAKVDGSISRDEFIMLRKAMSVFSLTRREKWYIESQKEIFPKEDKKPHGDTEIKNILTYYLRDSGLVFPIKKEGANNYGYIIPDEIAEVLREIYNIDLQTENLEKLLRSKALYSKKILKYICDEFNLKGKTLEDNLSEILKHDISAKQILETIAESENDEIKKSINELGDEVNAKQKFIGDKINGIIRAFDKKLTRILPPHPYAYLYPHYIDLASQNTGRLLNEKIIKRSEEIGKKFEYATFYIFEQIFKVRLEKKQKGKNSPDIEIRYGDNFCLIGDCKSSLNVEHKQKNYCKQYFGQFRDYINQYKSDKSIILRSFLVIVPKINDSCVELIHTLKIETGVDISIVSAESLKLFAEKWVKTERSLNLDIFFLGGVLDDEEMMLRSKKYLS